MLSKLLIEKLGIKTRLVAVNEAILGCRFAHAFHDHTQKQRFELFGNRRRGLTGIAFGL
jgi:hypothetical protein